MKSRFQRVKNPTGRLDVLAARLIERAVKNINRPEVSALYAEVKDPLEALIAECLNPRKKAIKELRKHIVTGGKILAEAQQRRVA